MSSKYIICFIRNIYMKNNLTCYFIGILLILFSNLVFSAPSGTISFEGKIIESPCVLSLSQSSANSLTVQMGVFMKDKVPTVRGEKIPGSEKPIEIKLDRCPNGSGYSIYPKIKMTAPNDKFHDKLIKLDESGAEGIAIGLYDSNGKLLDITKEYEHHAPFDNSNPFIIKLKAAYIANGQKVKAGQANATMNFDIHYK